MIELELPEGARLEPSTTTGHSHLYLDKSEMPFWRYAAMLTGLYAAGVIEMGFYVWAMRRRATFVRKPEIRKTSEENTKSEYGWLRRYK